MTTGKRMIGASTLFLATMGFAQEEVAKVVEKSSPRWTLRFEPAVSFAGPAGTLKLPSRAGGISASSIGAGARESVDLRDLEIDTPEPGLGGEIHLSRGDWRIGLRVLTHSGDERVDATGSGSIGSLSYGTGDEIATSLDYAQFELEGGYSLIKRDLSPYEKGFRFRTNLEAVVGLRVYDMDWSIDNATSGRELGADETFIEPLAGAKFTMELYEQFDIDVQLTGGAMPLGDKTSYSIDVMVGGVWRPVEHLGIQVGYRLTRLDLQSDESDSDFEWDGSMAGMYVGLVAQF
jgi:hypothetical protein